MEIGPGLRSGCRPESGDIEDANKTECRAWNGLMCNFTLGVVVNQTATGVEYGFVEDGFTGVSVDRCIFIPTYNQVKMSYACYTSYFDPDTGEDLSHVSSCPNNCIGVDTNDIVAGGAASECCLLVIDTTGTLLCPNSC